jgi:hypothetical protein
MAERRKIKRKVRNKKSGSSRRQRRERRFLAKTTQSSVAMFGLGLAGAFALGAGVFGQWVMDPAVDYAIYLIGFGTVGVVVSWWFGDTANSPVRVGDAGLALEKGNDIVRLAWCDIDRLYIENNKLLAESEELTLSIPLAAQPHAVAWALSEATRRLPDIVDVKRQELKRLPKPDREAGASVLVKGIQVAGRRCAASDKLISFERDARVCPNCCEVYQHEKVPEECVTCERPLGKRALSV